MPVAASVYYHVYQEGEQLPLVLLHRRGWESPDLAVGYPTVDGIPGIRARSTRAWKISRSGPTDDIRLHTACPGLDASGRSASRCDSGLFDGQCDCPDYSPGKSPEHVIGLGLVGATAKLHVNAQLLEDIASLLPPIQGRRSDCRLVLQPGG